MHYAFIIPSEVFSSFSCGFFSPPLNHGLFESVRINLLFSHSLNVSLKYIFSFGSKNILWVNGFLLNLLRLLWPTYFWVTVPYILRVFVFWRFYCFLFFKYESLDLSWLILFFRYFVFWLLFFSVHLSCQPLRQIKYIKIIANLSVLLLPSNLLHAF